MGKIKDLFIKDDVAPIIRRYFINTLFDSTFTLLGIIVGVSFATTSSFEIIFVTMLTGSLALGISTGVSVYEAETLEREREVIKLESHMLKDLEGTEVTKSSRSVIIMASLINFSTPMISCGVTIIPFLLAYAGIIEIKVAAVLAVVSALSILFVAGVYLGRLGKQNPWLKGARMVGFGLMAFFIGFILEYLIN